MTSSTAFVLGGGGHRGSYEVGMLLALAEAGIRPDAIFGTSIGAINGALFGRSPDIEGASRLVDAWEALRFDDLFPGTLWSRARSAVRQRTYVHANEHLRAWLTDQLGETLQFGDLAVEFACVAACIEDASEVWFSDGPLVEAILASSAVPGLLPPVEIGGRHYIDGGVVNSIPLSLAYASGASTIFVLHVGHVDDELAVPTNPWDVGVVAFEVARRHRFSTDLASVPADVELHILPTGATSGRFNDPSKLRYGDLDKTGRNVETAHAATSAYLTALT